MRVVHLAAGAAGMYCGSCMHDNRLAASLLAQGRDVVLLPLYTPLRTDEPDVSRPRVYYGGINVFLQQAHAFFRHTPWLLDRLFDVAPLLRSVGRLAARTRPEVLGAMTLAVLQGPNGPQRKELDKLIAGLRSLRPTLVHLPNLMFVGLAGRLKEALRVPVLCGLAGEDIFLDRLPEPYHAQVFSLIHTHAGDVDGFVAVTAYYARHAATHFGLPAERVHQIPMGIRTADFGGVSAPPEAPFTVGYLARVCLEKGVHGLGQMLIALRQRGRTCRVRVAGYLGSSDRPHLDKLRSELRHAGVTHTEFEYVGELSGPGKLRFLQSLHVLSVPTVYPESKGFYVLEALAAGVPVIMPAHGSFPELIAATGGGLLYEANKVQAHADAITRVNDDPELRQQLATRGRGATHSQFTAERMATEAWQLYERFAR